MVTVRAGTVPTCVKHLGVDRVFPWRLVCLPSLERSLPLLCLWSTHLVLGPPLSLPHVVLKISLRLQSPHFTTIGSLIVLWEGDGAPDRPRTRQKVMSPLVTSSIGSMTGQTWYHRVVSCHSSFLSEDLFTFSGQSTRLRSLSLWNSNSLRHSIPDPHFSHTWDRAGVLPGAIPPRSSRGRRLNCERANDQLLSHHE